MRRCFGLTRNLNRCGRKGSWRLFCDEHKKQPFTWFFVLIFTAVAGTASILSYFSAPSNQANNEMELSGYLTPANDPMPPTDCGEIQPPPNPMALYFGNSLVWTREGPTVSVIKVANEDLLSIRKSPNGIYLNAKIRSSDGRIIAEIIDNKFHINPNNYYRSERPDKHTLMVYDQEGHVVLNVRYLNPSAIKILGMFYSPKHPPILIEEEKQIIPPLVISRNCSKRRPGSGVIVVE